MSRHDPTLKNKVSPHIHEQLPEFVKSDHPLFSLFLKYYYEFLEAGELSLSGDNVYLLEETITKNRILSEDGERVVLEESVGKFTAGETIVGSNSNATAKILVDDFDDNNRLFVTSQQRFETGETITGNTSGAVSTVVSYRANPVQNIQQLLAYADVDNTVYEFLNKFRDSFMEAIPNTLAEGIEKRKLIKSIKDLYSAKGTEDGHKLFFRILFDEEPELIYPRDNLLRASDGEWSTDKVVRVTEIGNSDFSNAVGQTITGSDSGATAIVTTVIKFREGNVLIAELNLDPNSVNGEFTTEETITTTDIERDLQISATVRGIVTGANILNGGSYYAVGDTVAIGTGGNNAATARIETIKAGAVDEILIEAGGSGYSVGDVIVYDNTDTEGASARAKVAVVGGGFLLETDTDPDNVITEDGDLLTVNHTDNFALEDTTINTVYLIDETDEDNLILEDGNMIVAEYSIEKYALVEGTEFVDDGEIILEDGNQLLREEADIFYLSKEQTVGEVDHLVLESGYQIVIEEGTFANAYDADGHVDESAGYNSERGEITRIEIINKGSGYLKTPLVSVTSSSSGSGASLYACSVNEPHIGDVGGISITNFGLNYTSQPDIVFNRNFLVKNVTGSFTAGDTLTSHEGTVVDFDSNRNIVKISTSVSLEPDDVIITITGATAVVVQSDFAVGEVTVGTIGTTVGNFVSDRGKISVDSMKIQDSFYYQDYSYVVRVGESINLWRDSIRRSVHPAGWNVFGEVSFASQVSAAIQVPSAGSVTDNESQDTFSPELASTFTNLFTTIFGRRLGTTSQGSVSATPKVGYNDIDDVTDGERDVTLTQTISFSIGVANKEAAKAVGPTLENVAKFGFSVHPVDTSETFPNYIDPTGRRFTKANNFSRDQYTLAQIGYIGIRELCLADGTIPSDAYNTPLNFMPPSEIYIFRSGLTNRFSNDFISFDDGITQFDEFDNVEDTEGRYATSYDEVGVTFDSSTTFDVASGNEEDFRPSFDSGRTTRFSTNVITMDDGITQFDEFDNDNLTSETMDSNEFTFDNAAAGTTTYNLFSDGTESTFDSANVRMDETETQTTRYGFSMLDYTSDSNLIKYDQTVL